MNKFFFAGAAMVAALGANAQTVTATNDAATLAAAVQAATSGLTVLSQSVVGSATQTGTYTGFSLAPTSGATPTLNLPNGIVLTSGSAIVPASNTVNQFDGSGASMAGLSSLDTLTSKTTFDASALNLSFTVAAGVNSVSASFVFATDEFPTQTVTDVFAFFVDGVNYAKFPNGELISNTPGTPTNFISNPVGEGLYPIEYNGLTHTLLVTGKLDGALTTHTLQIALANTDDEIFQSGVYIGGLKAAASTGGGGITDDVPEPATVALMLAGVGVVGALARRKKTS
jgi:PEP-CTERM motif